VRAAAETLSALQSVTLAATSGASRKPLRGPALAPVELAAQLAAAGAGAPAAVAEAAWGYYEAMGSLVSCAVDLRGYLAGLEGSAAEGLAARLRSEDAAAAAAAAAGGAAAPQALRRSVCRAQMAADLGAPYALPAGGGGGGGSGGAAAHLAAALRHMRAFAEARGAYEGLDERERGPADELGPLAAAALMAAPAESGARCSPSARRSVPRRSASPRARTHTLICATPICLLAHPTAAANPFSRDLAPQAQAAAACGRCCALCSRWRPRRACGRTAPACGWAPRRRTRCWAPRRRRRATWGGWT